MPNSPTGGLSIFLNLTVVFLGLIFKTFKKQGYNSQFFTSLKNLSISKRYNGSWRIATGYAIAAMIFSFLFTVTTYSLSQRLKSESNFDYAKNMAVGVKYYYYAYNYDKKINKIEDYISVENLKYSILSFNN